MFCDCGGMLFVIRVEEVPDNLPKHEKLIYDRLCDLQCECGKVYYSQPYDWGKRLNKVKKISE